MDYSKQIDAETWAFIEATAEFYPPDVVGLNIEDQRAVYDLMCRAFRKDYPAGVVAQDTRAGAVPVRVYECGNSRTTVIYFHGGGFVVGGLHSHDDICAEICAGTGCRVVSVDYRLAPEHRHPAAFEDAQTALNWVHETFGGGVILAGDSAGSKLAAALAHQTRNVPVALLGQVLIYPMLGIDTDTGSFIEHANAPMLTRDDVIYYQAIRSDGLIPVADPSFAPLTDSDFSGLPPTFVFSAQCDPLSDDGRNYCDRILAAGGKAVWFNEAGLVHGYLRARHSVARAGDSFRRIVATIDALARAESRP